MYIFDLLEKYKGELIIVDAGRSTTLATAFILEKPMMKYVKEYYIMGGAFLMPGNVTPVAEANFHGDPIASQLVMQNAKNVTLVPLNVTSEAIITPEMVKYITKHSKTSFNKLIEPIFTYYYKAYRKLNPKIKGSPVHDVVTMMVAANPSLLDYVYRRVDVDTAGIAKGESIADFRPQPDAKALKIGCELVGRYIIKVS